LLVLLHTLVAAFRGAAKRGGRTRVLALLLAVIVGALVVYRQSPDPRHRVLARAVIAAAAVLATLALLQQFFVL
jgi:hypothetical protein